MSRKITEHQLRSIARPEWTETWHPIGHGELLDALYDANSSKGFRVIGRQYEVAGTAGSRFFGVWQIEGTVPGMSWALGFRNSTDKRLAVGLVAGTHVFVCSNLSFSGEYIEFRKHTSGLDKGVLTDLIYDALGRLENKMIAFEAWHDSLKNVPIRESEANALVIEAMRKGVVPPSRFRLLDRLFLKKNARYTNGTHTMWGFHEAITESMRDTSLFNISRCNRKMNDIINGYLTVRGLSRRVPDRPYIFS